MKWFLKEHLCVRIFQGVVMGGILSYSSIRLSRWVLYMGAMKVWLLFTMLTLLSFILIPNFVHPKAKKVHVCQKEEPICTKEEKKTEEPQKDSVSSMMEEAAEELNQVEDDLLDLEDEEEFSD